MIGLKVNLGFAGDASGKEPICQYRRHKRCGFNPGSGRSPGGGHSIPFQYSCLENPTDRRAWWATVYRVAKSQTRLKQQYTSESYHNSYVHILNYFSACLFYWFFNRSIFFVSRLQFFLLLLPFNFAYSFFCP